MSQQLCHSNVVAFDRVLAVIGNDRGAVPWESRFLVIPRDRLSCC